jgi:hypothetical protein
VRGIDERRTVGAQLQKLAEGEAGMGISNFLNFLLSSSYLSGFVLRRRLNDFFVVDYLSHCFETEPKAKTSESIRGGR